MKTKILMAALFVSVCAFLALKSPSYALTEKGQLVAYRGGGQLLDYANFDHRCAATQIVKSSNTHIENTQQSIEMALEAGFDVIHLNIHRTADGAFAVFHDWTLECATNGTGVTSKREMDYLKSLDAGFGYTFDGGQTFPWRGKGYRISSLDEVIHRYPEAELWLNMKTGSRDSVEALLDYKASLLPRQRESLFHFAANKNLSLYAPNGTKRSALSIESGKKCIRDYMLYGWSRFFPESCANTKVLVPPALAKYLWGWPEQFAARAQKNGSRVYLWLKHRHLGTELDFVDKGVGVITGDLAGASGKRAVRR